MHMLHLETLKNSSMPPAELIFYTSFFCCSLILNREELSKSEMRRLAYVAVESVFADDGVKHLLREIFEAVENDHGI